MSRELPVSNSESAQVKYSAAYSKGRELMLEPLYGCAEEALLRRVASPYGEPEGPSRGRARALSELEFRVELENGRSRFSV